MAMNETKWKWMTSIIGSTQARSKFHKISPEKYVPNPKMFVATESCFQNEWTVFFCNQDKLNCHKRMDSRRYWFSYVFSYHFPFCKFCCSHDTQILLACGFSNFQMCSYIHLISVWKFCCNRTKRMVYRKSPVWIFKCLNFHITNHFFWLKVLLQSRLMNGYMYLAKMDFQMTFQTTFPNNSQCHRHHVCPFNIEI